MLDGSDTALAKNENETSGSGVRRRLTCVYNDGKCGDGGVGENVKFCRGEQRCFLTRYGDVRQGVILRGKLVDARLEIVRKGLVPCQSSLQEFLKNDLSCFTKAASNPIGSKMEEIMLNSCRSVCDVSIVFSVGAVNVPFERHQV